MKVIIWFTGVIITLLIVAYLLINSFEGHLLKDNLIVRTKGLDRNGIKLKWVSENKTDTLLLFENGQQLERKIGKMGLNTFLLTYHEEHIASFNQFVTSNLAMHDYVFEIQKKQDSIKVDFQIFGPDQSL